MKSTRSLLRGIRLVVIGLLASILLVACGSNGSIGASQKVTSTSTPARPPLHLSSDAYRYSFDTPKAMCTAPLVAEIVVASTGPSSWNTSDGSRPATDDAKAINKAGYGIYTEVHFAKLNLLLDHRSKPTQRFLMLGGQVGQDTYAMSGFPQLSVSSRYVVVFTPNLIPTTSGYTEDTLVVYDAFPIDQQDVVTLQQAGNPNEPGIGPVQQQVTMPLAQLQQDLAHC